MSVIVDAWNVLHVTGVLPPGLAGLSLSGLGRLMQATRWQTAHCVLVCDGPPQPRPQGLPRPIHLLWSGSKLEADDLVEDLIARAADPMRLVVVSSDRRLRKAAKRRRCKWLDSEAFLRTILEDVARGTAPADPPPPGSDDWTAEFGLGEAELAALQEEVEAADFDTLPSQRPTTRDVVKPPSPDPPPARPVGSFPADVLEQARRIAGEI